MRVRTVVIVGVVSYGLYKSAEKVLLSIPASFITEIGEGLDDRFPAKIANKLIKKLPYSGFCEISGCRVEVHATTPEAFHGTMSDHLRKAH